MRYLRKIEEIMINDKIKHNLVRNYKGKTNNNNNRTGADGMI